MSANNLKRLAVPALLVMLAACGGDDDGVFSSGQSSTGGGSQSEDGETVVERSLAIGTGEGDGFQEGVIGSSTSNLSAGGTSQLTFNVVDRAQGNALIAGEGAEVSITSGCLSRPDPLSTIDAPSTLSTSSGEVSIKYRAEGCSGTDTVTATLTSGGSASVNLTIATATAIAIESSDPVPASIAPDGLSTASRPSISRVSFTVVDSQGNSVSAGKEVSFRLSFPRDNTESLGAPFLENVDSRDVTSATGEVTAVVRAGTQNTVVRVVASIVEDGQIIETTSPPISINTSVPHQAGFSISTASFAPNAWDHDGVTVDINILANDLNGDFIRGGTIVNFTTTGGAINGDCELDEQGACTVTWRSQNPRPADGRVVILARSVGDESFNDLNSNGVFESGETLSARGERGEAFHDVNRNQIRDSDEQYFGDDGNGTYDGPDGVYDGSACVEADETAGLCTQGPVTVWGDTFIIMASDAGIDIDLSQVGGQICATASGQAEAVNRTPLPAGTTFDFEIEDTGEITSARSSFTVADEYNPFDFSTYCVEATGPGTLTVTVTPPAPFDGDGPQQTIDL